MRAGHGPQADAMVTLPAPDTTKRLGLLCTASLPGPCLHALASLLSLRMHTRSSSALHGTVLSTPQGLQAARMVEAANEFAVRHLSPLGRSCYLTRLLVRWHSLLAQPPQVGS